MLGDWIVAFSQDEKTRIVSILSTVSEIIDSGKAVCPPMNLIFRAFELTPPQETKVVIVGQDPYYSPLAAANGLAFAVNKSIAQKPPSLQNIFKELSNDLFEGNPVPIHDLTSWAVQGVLLLNSTLTVEFGVPNSHFSLGWFKITDRAIEYLSKNYSNIVYILWGAFAQGKRYLIDSNKNLIIESSHPSPLSANRGFFGSKPFSKTNTYLTVKGKTPIKWADVIT